MVDSPSARSSQGNGVGTLPAFERLKRDTRLSDRVARQVLQAVVGGKLAPGDRLPTERDLAQQFGVSRTVVREAVRSLAGRGIIEARAGLGLRVAQVAASDVAQAMELYLRGSSTLDYRRVHEVRTTLEVDVAGLAAARATEDEIRELGLVCDRMQDVLEDVEAASRLDFRFHEQLAAATHNELYQLLLSVVSAPLMDIRRETFALPGRAAIALSAHRSIYGSVASRDVLEARELMRSHLDDVERAWERLA
jgi:GntR family transcriptional repressor for pyruvate dehydrogenase complex